MQCELCEKVANFEGAKYGHSIFLEENKDLRSFVVVIIGSLE